MDKVIVTALLTMAGVIGAILVINTVLPALGRSGSSVLSSSSAASDIIKTDIKIIAVEATGTSVYVWVKNVGSGNVLAISRGDAFLEDVGTSFTRFAFEAQDVTSDCSGAAPATGNWNYCIEDGESIWKPNYTVKLTLTVSPAPTGDYKVKFTTNNGVDDEKSFSV